MLKLTKLQSLRIVIIYSLLVLAAFFCYNAKKLLLPANRRPFQCSDKSLAKPFVDDTVPTKQLHVLGIYFPIALIVICELMSSVRSRQKALKLHSSTLKCILRIIILVTLFLMGLAVERMYKNVAKNKMARLRPNFITVCQPVMANGMNCLSLTSSDIMYEYECSSSTGYPAWAVATAFASFPSGHTSLTAYGMVFSIYYLYLYSFRRKRLNGDCSTLVILIVQVLCFLVILFVAISRVLDFRHHWSDVCAGFIGGSSVALAINYYLQSQLENMEKWLKEVTNNRKVEHAETIEVGVVSPNINEKEGKSSLELISE